MKVTKNYSYWKQNMQTLLGSDIWLAEFDYSMWKEIALWQFLC